MNEQPILDVKNLRVTYAADTANPVHAVDALSCNLQHGECLGIIGESGCGKTSVALALMGLLSNARVRGDVVLDGTPLNDLSDSELRAFRWAKIAMVFQNGLDALNPVLTIRAQIAEVLQTHTDLSRKQIKERVLEIFDLVQLDAHWLEQYPHQLSGGMRQRALLAMALACEPDLIIVDEPTSALDALTRNSIIQLIRELQQTHNFAMICISHDFGAVGKLADRILTLYAGQAVEIGPAADVIREPLHPYTRGLLNSAPELLKYKDLWGLHGEPPASGGTPGCPFYPRCSQSIPKCRQRRPQMIRTKDKREVACHKGGIETLLTAHSLSKTYRIKKREIPAVSNANLYIKSSEVVALVGSSGSGKSTLAHMLTGVLKSDSGSVSFLGNCVHGSSASRIPHGVQLVFQDPFATISPRLTVLEAVREPLDIMKTGNVDNRNQRVHKMLKKTKLPTELNFLRRKCGTLSGGQRQRVAIARALVTQPRVLVADEITSMLDPSTQAHILRELKGLQNSHGFAMLYITHDIHLARKFADRVYIKQHGKIIEHGFATEIFDNPVHEHTRELLG